MELRQLKTFRTVASLASFSQAADILGYAQSTISEQIKALETELQADLFKRAGGKQVALTAAGEILLQYAQKMLNLEDEIRSEVNLRTEAQGTLSIRVPETVSVYYLPPILNRFRQRFAKINFNLNNCAYFSLPEELKAGVTDLAFLITDIFQTPELITEILRPIPLVMVTHPSHPLANCASIHAGDLRDEPLIVPTNDCSYVQMLERLLAEQKVELHRVWRLNSISAIKQVLLNGIGISVLPELLVEKELAESRLSALPWQDGPITANLLMIRQRNKWTPPALEAFIGMVRENLTIN